jgi:aminoglycoside phosphotransferase (APT) family kinase protein
LPKLRWNEPEGGPFGTPFFVMDQVDGRIPLDNPPYVFTGWLLEATPSERARLQRASIAVLAELHAIAEPNAAFPGLCPPDGVDSLRSHVASQAD